jgi:hypothetical protein
MYESMTLTHFTDTDSLYLEFSRRPRGEIREIAKDARGGVKASRSNVTQKLCYNHLRPY